MNELKKDGKTLIGVHIRRGDYKEWRKGKLYFSDEVYANFMQMCINVFGASVNFVCVSNETINVEYFLSVGLPVIGVSGTPQEDVCTLSLCDYILGPTSTFTWWAAFMGDKCRFEITDPSDVISKEGFVKVRRFVSVFE